MKWFGLIKTVLSALVRFFLQIWREREREEIVKELDADSRIVTFKREKAMDKVRQKYEKIRSDINGPVAP